jgi:tRNA (cmo5U34)-methyltransferase
MTKKVGTTQMPQFEESLWADSEFSQNYRDDANIFLPFRSQFIKITKSFYEHFISQNIEAKVLDLGCGDGLFIQELLKSYTPARVMLVDGSNEMLAAANERIGSQKNIHYTQASFQELLAHDPLNENFDFIYSSLAIHHLPFDEKKNLYAYIHEHLSTGGYFVHYDVVVPPSEKLEKCYLSIWREWIKQHPAIESREELIGIPEQYKGNQDNIPDTMESQLEALKKIGFRDVDCYFKYGIFSLFGGCK